jgi:hypothetical protein
MDEEDMVLVMASHVACQRRAVVPKAAIDGHRQFQFEVTNAKYPGSWQAPRTEMRMMSDQ